MLSGLSGLSGLSAVCGGAAAAFSPTQLSGYVNSPYNIALLRSQGKMWQDTAMTVPATADGDPVRRIDCGGTYYDAPSDPARPLLYSEGSGKWSLSFDGVDDYVTRTAAVPINVTLAYGFQLAATASFPMLFSGGGSARELRSEAAGAVLSVIIDSHTTPISGAPGSIVLNHWYTGIAACGGGGVSTELYQDGTQTAQDAADSTNADGTVWDIGARSGSYPWPGRMTGVVFLSRKATVAEVGQLNTYLAALAPSTPPFPENLTGYVDSPYNIALLRLHGNLWQDTTFTTRATADGDPVRRIVCGSTYYDAPSDAARPLLYSEGSGKWSLSFDGVDDYIAMPTVLGDTTSIIVRFLTTATVNENRGIYTTLGEGSGTYKGTYLSPRNTAGYAHAFWIDGNNGISQLSALTSAQWYTSTALCDSASEWRIDGVSKGTSPYGASNSQGVPLRIGRSGYNGDFSPCRIAGFLVVGSVLTGTDLTNSEAYLAALAP